MNIPKLYRYRYFDDQKSDKLPQWELALFKGMVIPASPMTFNDPFDCDLLIDDSFVNSNCFQKLLQDNLAEKHLSGYVGIISPKSLDELRQHLLKFKKEMLVACFSETNTSVLMWSHYARNHTGFCIEYNLSDWQANDNLRPVQYSSSAPIFGKSYLDNNTLPLGSAVVEAVLHKAAEWSYEKEWRIVVPKQNCADIFAQGYKPAFDFGRFITAIYIGAKASDKYIQLVCKHFCDTNIAVYQMKLQPNTYQLIPNRLQ